MTLWIFTCLFVFVCVVLKICACVFSTVFKCDSVWCVESDSCSACHGGLTCLLCVMLYELIWCECVCLNYSCMFLCIFWNKSDCVLCVRLFWDITWLSLNTHTGKHTHTHKHTYSFKQHTIQHHIIYHNQNTSNKTQTIKAHTRSHYKYK